MTKKELNKLLRDAIGDYDVGRVTQLLKQGADPNYIDTYYKELHGQPYSPLRLVIFVISNVLYEDEALEELAKIATVLLDFGADAQSALQLSEERYGRYDPKTGRSSLNLLIDPSKRSASKIKRDALFWKVVQIVSNA